MRLTVFFILFFSLLLAPGDDFGQKKDFDPSVRTLKFMVRNGDNIKNIAPRIHISLHDIMKANKIHSQNYIAYPGKILNLPVQIQPKVWDPNKEDMGMIPSREDRRGIENYDLVIDSTNYYLEEDFISLEEIQGDSIEYNNLAAHIKKVDNRINYIYFKIDSFKHSDFNFEYTDNDKNSIESKMKLSQDKYYIDGPMGRQIDSLGKVKEWLGKRRIVLRNKKTEYEYLSDNASYAQHNFKRDENRNETSWGQHLAYENSNMRQQATPINRTPSATPSSGSPPTALAAQSQVLATGSLPQRISTEDPAKNNVKSQEISSEQKVNQGPSIAPADDHNQAINEQLAAIRKAALAKNAAATTGKTSSADNSNTKSTAESKTIVSPADNHNQAFSDQLAESRRSAMAKNSAVPPTENIVSDDATIKNSTAASGNTKKIATSDNIPAITTDKVSTDNTKETRSLSAIKATASTDDHNQSLNDQLLAIRKTAEAKKQEKSQAQVISKSDTHIIPESELVNLKDTEIEEPVLPTRYKSDFASVKRQGYSGDILVEVHPSLETIGESPHVSTARAAADASLKETKENPIQTAMLSAGAVESNKTSAINKTDDPPVNDATKAKPIDVKAEEKTNEAVTTKTEDATNTKKRETIALSSKETKNTPKYLIPVDSNTIIKGEFYTIRARQALEKGDTKNGEKYLKKSLEINPNNASTWMLHADLFLTMGLDEQALKEYLISGEIDSTNPKVFYNIALLYNKSRNIQKEIQYFTKAINLNDKYLPAYMGRASVLADQNNYTAAINDYDKILTINKYYSPAFKARGLARMEAKKFADAIADFNQYTEIEGKDGFIIYERGLSKIYSNNLLQGCLDLSEAQQLGYKDAEKAIKKFCE